MALPFAAVVLALALATAGCTDTSNDELTKAVVAGVRKVAMDGSGAFFGGAVTARITVSRGIGRGYVAGRSHSVTDSGVPGRPGGGPGRDESKAFKDYEDSDTKQLVGSPLPPVTLHLILANAGPEPVTIVIDDFESDLGNFAIDPDTLTVAPGETAEPTAMVSQLGVTSDHIPFTVTLVKGGTRETRTIVARSILGDSAEPRPGGP